MTQDSLRQTSSQNLSNLTSPMASPDSNIPSPSKSGLAPRSPGSSWPNKLGGFITGKNKNPALTEESICMFNKRNEIMEERYSSSPYYKGLTDFSLVINREKSSPGRESFTTAGTKSSFAVKLQGWGGYCFASKKNDKCSSPSLFSSSSASSRVVETVVLTNTRTKTNDSASAKERVNTQSTKIGNTLISPALKKPLRERDSGAPALKKPLRERDSGAPALKKPLRERDSGPPLESLSQVIHPTLQALHSPPPAPPLDTLLPSVIHTSPPPFVEAPPPRTNGYGGAMYENKEGDTAEKERMYNWADKYRPFWLQDFLCNREKALWLKGIVRNWQDTEEECGHFIFEGNPGVGKRTMIGAMLREAFGEDKVQATEQRKTFTLKGEAVSSIPVNLMVSKQHVEVNLSELKGYEKHVLVEFIKEDSQMLAGTTLHCDQENCKAMILHDADKLSTDALSYIKWMLEKFKGCNKVFFCCKDAKKLQNIMPLCRYVQLNEPSIEEIIRVLEFIAEKEGLQLPHQLAYKIARNSQNNLRQAIRSFEATWHTSGCTAYLMEDQEIKTGWETKIANIAKNILEEQSPKQLYNIRGDFQNLEEHNVAPEFIVQTLNEDLKKLLPEWLQPQFDLLYDEHQYQKHRGCRKYLPNAHQEEELGERKNDQRKNVQEFMRIEEFIARFMSWYKDLVAKNLVV